MLLCFLVYFKSANDQLPARVLLMILHDFGVRNATLQQMAGKLQP